MRQYAEPERWSDRADGHSAEDAVGAVMRRVRQSTEPSSAELARWGRQAIAEPAGRNPRLAWSVAVGVVAVLLAAGVGAAHVIARAARRAPALSPPRTTPAAVAPQRHALHKTAAASAITEPLGEPEPPAPVPAATAALAPPPLSRAPLPVSPALGNPTPAAPSAPSTAPPVTGVAPRITPPSTAATVGAEPGPPTAPARFAASEAALVEQAFRCLRTDRDPRAALSALETHDRLFPTGAMQTEAALARAEALVALGRDREALPILLDIRDPKAGLTREIRAARGEILVKNGRCPEAVTDFDVIIAATDVDGPRERALWGRAACRLRGGDRRSAFADLGAYVAEFPRGQFAAAAREAVARLRTP